MKLMLIVLLWMCIPINYIMLMYFHKDTLHGLFTSSVDNNPEKMRYHMIKSLSDYHRIYKKKKKSLSDYHSSWN